MSPERRKKITTILRENEVSLQELVEWLELERQILAAQADQEAGEQGYSFY